MDNDFDISDEFKIHVETNRQMIIPRKVNEYQLFKMIRETDISVVLSVLGQNYAIKCIPINHFIDHEFELEIMTEYQHPNLMECIEYFPYPQNDSRFLAIVMPHAKSDLFDYLLSRGYGRYGKYFTEDLVFGIMDSALNAVKFLHDNCICHRDIKLENIFVMKDTKEGPLIKIGDFGFAFQFEPSANFKIMRGMGTIPYAAPELLCKDDSKPDFRCSFTKDAKYSCNIDVWSLGVVMYVLLSGRYPFGSPGNYDIDAHLSGAVSFDIQTDQYSVNPFDNVSDSCKKVISAMLNPNRINRLNVDEVLLLPWFSEKHERMPTLVHASIQYANQIGIMTDSQYLETAD